MVRGDYRVEYFADQKTFETNGKPKGTIILGGYTIVTDPNARKMAVKRDLYARFGVEEEVAEYTKYEAMTIECFHPTRRRWLIKCSSAEDFEVWSAMFTVCAQRCTGRTLKEPARIEAFDQAFAQARLALNVPRSQVRGSGEGGKEA